MKWSEIALSILYTKYTMCAEAQLSDERDGMCLLGCAVCYTLQENGLRYDVDNCNNIILSDEKLGVAQLP